MISGAFSLCSQAISLGFLPRLKVDHTSSTHRGQIYIQSVNWPLFVLTMILCLGFRTSSSITNAYGLCVCIVTCITSTLFLLVCYYNKRLPCWAQVLYFVLIVPVDIIFLCANFSKIPTGGWVPVIVSIVVSGCMLIWRYGKALEGECVKDNALTKEQVIRLLENDKQSVNIQKENGELALTMEAEKQLSFLRAPGFGVFVGPQGDDAPHVFTDYTEMTNTCPSTVIFLHLQRSFEPVVSPDKRYTVVQHGAGIYTVQALFGYDEANPDVVSCLDPLGDVIGDRNKVTYYFSGEKIVPKLGLNYFKRKIVTFFCFMHSNVAGPTANLVVPEGRVIQIGKLIELK